MDIILEELTAGLPDAKQLAPIVIRLLVAMLLGAVVGIQREQTGKPAGVRTHMLVSLGAALFVLAPVEAGMGSDDLSRVIQGLATGIGFIGGGAILKRSEEREIQGLTTAAGISPHLVLMFPLAAAMGVAAGLGRIGMALLSALLTWFILAIIGMAEHRMGARRAARGDDPETRNEVQ